MKLILIIILLSSLIGGCQSREVNPTIGCSSNKYNVKITKRVDEIDSDLKKNEVELSFDFSFKIPNNQFISIDSKDSFIEVFRENYQVINADSDFDFEAIFSYIEITELDTKIFISLTVKDNKNKNNKYIQNTFFYDIDLKNCSIKEKQKQNSE